MKELFHSLRESISNGRDAVIVSVVASSGSTPRGAGAKMLVNGDGRVCGTVGGGAIEHEAEQLAAGFLREKTGGIRDFRLAPNQIRDLGMVCGGGVSIYFQYLEAGNGELIAFVDETIDKIKLGKPCWLITDITAEDGGKMGTYSVTDGFSGLAVSGLAPVISGKAKRHSVGGRDYLTEQLVEPGIVYVFGGGHVSREFVPAASRVGFRCVVLDDRPEFTSREDFPDAEGTAVVDFGNLNEAVEIREHDYIVIMTRGHQYDTTAQAFALRTRARYIGVMGSRSKIAHVKNKLREQGFTDEDMGRVNTPIGLDIGAETPAELAVSITAELIMTRAEKEPAN